MKTFRFLLLSLLLLISGISLAQGRDLLGIRVDKEVLGKTLKVEVSFTNAKSNNYTAFQMDIAIPEGFDYIDQSMKPGLRLLGHLVSVAPQAGNILRVTAFSPHNAEIGGNEGTLFSFIIGGNDQAKRGYINIKALQPVFAKRDGSEYTLPQTSRNYRFVPFDELKPYELTFTVDGQEFKKLTLLEGETIPPVEAPVKEGHTFTGWTNLPVDMPSRNLTISASFSVNTYVITYYLNGTIYSRQHVKYGTTINPPKITPAENETFLGWEDLPETMPASDLTIHGKTEITGIEKLTATTMIKVYNLQGVLILSGVTLEEARNQLPRGLYIVNGQLLYIK